mmetsp:Transcript_19813/g.35445  ORF Transcript_19813/g.35445 Transcript_19813/m.35445 type:complete len:424 (+) Transcript_19813:121-1392(+)
MAEPWLMDAKKVIESSWREDLHSRRQVQSRIIGGTRVNQNSLAWMGSIQDEWASRSGHYCGATLISPSFALSAAHCLEGIFEVQRIVFNASDLEDTTSGVSASMKNLYYPPTYEYSGDAEDNIRDDLLLIELQEAVFGIEPVALALESGTQLEALGHELFIVGWGFTYEDANSIHFETQLRQATVPVVDTVFCNETYQGSLYDSNICAGDNATLVNTCVGDSGGPLYGFDEQGRARQVGVTSWGRTCNRIGSIGVYTRISALSKWITSIVYDLDKTVNSSQIISLEPTSSPYLFPTGAPTSPITPSFHPRTSSPTVLPTFILPPLTNHNTDSPTAVLDSSQLRSASLHARDVGLVTFGVVLFIAFACVLAWYRFLHREPHKRSQVKMKLTPQKSIPDETTSTSGTVCAVECPDLSTTSRITLV